MIDWRLLAVSADAPLLEALQVIDRGGLQFVLVVEGERLVGLATDGDIRRALVGGLPTSTSIRHAMNPKPTVGLVSEHPSHWLRKLRDRQIRHLPIVDADGRLVRVVTAQNCAQPRSNWAVVMAGGLGTRLRPITEHVPKPMIEIGGTPILEIILRSLTGAGISRVFFAVNYRANMISDYFGDGARWDARVEYLHEPKRLGTAGALSLLPQAPPSPLLVMNGDILTGLNYGQMLDEHTASRAAATMCIREYATQIPYGVAEVDGHDLRGIIEKPIVTHLASAGIYALSPETLGRVPQAEYLDMPALFQGLIGDGQRVRVHRIDANWIDVGRLDDLQRAQLEFGNPPGSR
jgi:dTDP-glucose pyrophosphorylase